MARSKDYVKNSIELYKDKTISFKEFFNALKALGYADVSTSTHLRFQKIANSVLSIPMRSLEDSMQLSDFRTYCYIIYMKGDIENPNDLIDLIEKNRQSTKVEMAFA